MLPHIPFAIALNTIGRETGEGIPGASTAKTTSLGIIHSIGQHGISLEHDIRRFLEK